METQQALRKCFTQDDDFKERMYAKQIAVMKGQAWNVVETLKTPDHGPLELTRRARVCVWDDLVEIPIAVPLRAPSAEMRQKTQSHRQRVPEEEEMDITTLSTPRPKPQADLLLNSPPLEVAKDSRFNLSRENSSLDVVRPDDQQRSGSPANVQGSAWNNRARTGSPSVRGSGRPNHRPRMSYDAPRRRDHEHKAQGRRLSLSSRRGSNGLLGDDDDEGDLGYAANEDMDGNRKRVIVERLEMVKAKNPVFTWC